LWAAGFDAARKIISLGFLHADVEFFTAAEVREFGEFVIMVAKRVRASVLLEMFD